MENEFLDKMDDNAVVQIWSEKTQLEKGDSLTKGYASELWDCARISMTQNNLQELKEIWTQWDDEVKWLFYCNYGDLPYLLDIKMDKHLFRALAQFWNFAHSCFTFGKVDLVPTVEEYIALLRYLKIQVDRAYSRAVNVPTFAKKLMNITGMREQWVTARIRQKGESKFIPWKSLRDLILAHPDTKKKVDVFALSIYRLLIFPKVLEHIDEAVSDLFDRLDRRVTLVPLILAETFRFLNPCKRTGEGRFIGCTQLMLAWFHSHFWKVEKEDVEWKAPWKVPDEILYRCGDFDWFILATQGLAQCEFSYKGDNYKKKIREMSNAWNQTHQIKRFVVGPIATLEYYGWWNKRINDNIFRPSQEGVRPIEEYLQVVPSEIEIIKQDFEKRNSELVKKIKQLEEEKMHLRLDVDVQKLETEKLRKGKNKAKKDLDSLKTNYKKLRLLMRTTGLGKTLEQWC
ncbi:hypothetical protein Goshw_000700 [Gossypium schwendimanii]|uniref:DUF7745 domain-containing protein n=1 Tax=Gossypium schwendimanii TaxID=34291 RepID=A0A7J9KVR6_GOSSC|nr:hypothetical protein [Gossypium schwendimanii]